MSCSAGCSPLLATVDLHSDIRSDLAVPDIFVTSARLSQVRLHSDYFLWGSILSIFCVAEEKTVTGIGQR